MRFITWLLTYAVALAARPGSSTASGSSGASQPFRAEVEDKWFDWLLVSLIFGAISSFVKPILQILSIPFIIITLGLFLLVINAGMLLLTGWLAEQFDIGFHVDGFWTAVGGAIVITIVTWMVDGFLQRRAGSSCDGSRPAPAARARAATPITFVCLGNICRSPMAHVVLEAKLEEAGLADRVEVTSSGTGGWHVGDPMDQRAAATLTARRLRPHAGTAPASTTRPATAVRPGAGHGRAPTSPTSAAADDRVRLFRDFDPVDSGCGRAGPVLRWTRRVRGGPAHGRAHHRGDRGRAAAASTPCDDPPAAGRQARRGAPRLLGGGHGTGRRRRHLHRHPDAAQRRHHRADEDATRTPPRASSTPRCAACAGWRRPAGSPSPRCSPPTTSA